MTRATVGLAVVLLCGLAGADEAARPDILFLTIDTLRVDRLAAYGAEEPYMPTFDDHALSARVFTDIVADMPQTGPSMCSMFTSLPARLTGCVRNGVPLPADTPSITQVLQEAGYETAAIVSNWNLKRKLSSLDRGFDYYDDDFGTNWLGRPQQELYGDEVTTRASAWLDERAKRAGAKKPLFFWVHYMDPHAPYRFHNEYNPAGVDRDALNERDDVRLRYDSECGFVDHHAGRLLRRALADGMAVVFTADHGESLFEHNYLGHTRQIYQVMMHIPLMVWAPGVDSGRDDIPGRGIDLGPTLLGIAGLEPMAGARGRDLLAAERPVIGPRVFETYGGDVNEGAREVAVVVDREPDYRGVIDAGWKLITQGDDEELYYLPEDTYEEHDRAEAEPARVRALREAIRSWLEDTPRALADPALLSPEDVEALEAAGYL